MFNRLIAGFRGLKTSYKWAVGIFAAVVLWVMSGQLTGHSAPPADNPGGDTAVASVRVMTLTASPQDATITVRGRTQAKHEVDTRAEVEGVVQAIHFDKGDRVRKGAILCEIKDNDRSAKVAQAEAVVAQ